ncbi:MULTISPECIES: RagB/SusD family nutrient uptake outer membrane protein [unclassified Spirosoma]|uniref:RagB/SusD family nutrient uptake outer membrane protein n=1 Tax=unclassified Spirosoma TaxID=2621999 RepID=UPI00095E3498|nr:MULTISPECIES: RagB/SusD family nutrient uptake outer membrane protein [unclassified Spirosoma]MBN8824888.1 RagB/SusD family nutrient uptake outer membrane protein [Spirosoma sp.]OJW74787.1 MAG: RagB/SusD family nutrient uptake outer membrane protein [Spirosoma sp. 48-14]
MKRIYQLPLLFIALASALTGCQLAEKPYSFITPSQFYNTASDAEAALTAAYTPITDLYSRVGTQVPDYSADQCFPRAVVGREQLTVFSYDATNDLIGQYWQHCYNGVNRANQVIENVPRVSMDETRKKQILAEAQFLRGLYYFHLVKTFGDVPIKQISTKDIASTEAPKSKAEDVYAFLIKDLEQAVKDLPAQPKDRGRAASGAAQGLLAKAYLYAGNYAKAAENAQSLLQSNRYSLMPNVLDLYNPLKEDAARAEMIFAAEFSALSGLIGYDLVGFYAPANSPPVFSKTAFGSAFGYMSFYKSFNPIDKRRQLLDTAYVNATGVLIGQSDVTLKDRILVKKFLDPNSNGANGENNFPILRLADVYLIAAEAEARQNGPTSVAYAAINTVRRRAGIPDLTTGLTKDAFIEAVLQERSWELCYEADRWYDLTRTGKFKLVANVLNSYYPSRPVQDKHRFFPIPNLEILTNSQLEQNPAWK